MPDGLNSLRIGAWANNDQIWASYRHMLFSMGFSEVGCLAEKLDQEDAGEWLFKQHPDLIQVVCMIAGVASSRMSLEIIAGEVDEMDDEGFAMEPLS